MLIILAELGNATGVGRGTCALSILFVAQEELGQYALCVSWLCFESVAHSHYY